MTSIFCSFSSLVGRIMGHMVEMSTATIACADHRLCKDVVRTARAFGFRTEVSDMKVVVRSASVAALDKWTARFEKSQWTDVVRSGPLNTYMKLNFAGAAPAVTRSWFKATEYATIYGFPAPNPLTKVVVGVVSFGGGLVGTVNANGVLTGGDVQAYWSYLGIPAGSMPTVVVVGVGGAVNTPNPNDGSTGENTLDVEMIGAGCPSANLTIIMYIAPNSLDGFGTVMNYMLNTPVTVNGVAVKPSIISISWGAPEIYYTSAQLSTINGLFATAASRGIPVTVAAGDNGSNDGVGGTGSYCDFPSSSPNVIACGGTNLICPNYTYDGSTVESVWSGSGGAISAAFTKPTYQSTLSGLYRRTPDIAMNADPNTGVLFILGGQYVVYGGTSVVAPAMAGYLAAVNAKVFVNPVLYNAPSSTFHDITSGSNGAFSAGTGYDDCTGLGSIKGGSLASLLGSASGSVTSVSLNSASVTIHPNGTYQALATLNPVNPLNPAVSWSSNATGVATVNSSGLVRGVANGIATITVTTADGGKTASLSVTVTTLVSGVSLNLTTLSLAVGGTSQLAATLAPPTASNTAVTWTSSAPTVATVSAGGLVTGIKTGSAQIRVTSVDGGFTATSSVTVVVRVTGITLNHSTLAIRKGLNSTLTATVAPTTATNKSVTWRSSNTTIATVSSSGVVTAKRVAGTSTITVTTVDGAFTASCLVTVS